MQRNSYLDTLIEPEIIFKTVESQDNMIAVVNSHFTFQEPIVSYRLLNIEAVAQIAKRVRNKPYRDPRVERFQYPRHILEHIGTTKIRCVMIYFLVGMMFTFVHYVAEPFK